jgi:hypothetical protein
MATTIRMRVMNGTDDQREKAVQSAVLLQSVINTQEFKDKILSFINSKRKIEFAENQGLTNIQVYEVLMSGQERLRPEKDYEWDFEVNFYTGRRFSKVIGFTFPNITYINCNTRFFNNMDIWEIAGNYAHEYCHKLGFDHVSAKQYDSIPYAVGYIVQELGEEFVKKLATKRKPELIN